MRMRTGIVALILVSLFIAGAYLIAVDESLTKQVVIEANPSNSAVSKPSPREPKTETPRPDERPAMVELGEKCLTVEEAMEDPRVLQDLHNYYSIAPSGPDIEAFRGVSKEAVRSFVVQNDAAAMVVLGAMADLRARGLDENLAVALLSYEKAGLNSFSGNKSWRESHGKELDEAAHWYYQAALHGRIFALQNFGSMLLAKQESPIDRGWITQQEHDSLSKADQARISPINIYSYVVYDLLPNLKYGIFGDSFSTYTPKSEIELRLREQVVNQFLADQRAANLPPVHLAEPATRHIDDLENLICRPDRAE